MVVSSSVSRSRRPAFIRTIATLCLLWACFDLGAHGFLASDQPPVTPLSSTARVGAASAPADTVPACTHCFCHTFSTGAVLPALDVALVAVGGLEAALPQHLRHGDPRSLDRPPQSAA